MASSFAWTNEYAIKLIHAYEKSPTLWDNSYPDHRLKVKRNEAWEQLSTCLNLPRIVLETKIHTLRSQFTREMRRIKKGALKNKEFTSSWFAFDHMTFLLKNEDATGESGDYNGLDNNDTFNSSNEFIVEEQEDSDPFPTEVECDKLPFTFKNRKRKIRYEENNRLSFNSGTSNCKKNLIADDLDIYAQYIVSELKAIGDEHSLLMAKFKINNTLLAARLGKFRNKENTTVQFKIENMDDSNEYNDSITIN